MAQVCFDSSTFYTVIIIGICVIVYVLIVDGHTPYGKTDRDTDVDSKNGNHDNELIEQLKLGLLLDQSRRLDMDRFLHPLVPPVRRGIGNLPSLVPIGIPTRGEYGPFHMLGYLHNDADTDQAMPLMGRRIHSNQYEYYTFHHGNPTIKIPIRITKEIQDNENITLPSYPGVTFRASIYDIDLPRYVPY